jgi:group I intron endonuclease
MKKNKLCGIYCIRNITNNKKIVGSSYDIMHRFATHKNKLKYNLHNNPYLQNAWNKYGGKSFSFEIIEECLEDNLIAREDFFIVEFKTLDRNFGYNFTLGSRHTQNEESKEKIRQSRLGKKMSEEQKRKLSESHKGKKYGKYSPQRCLNISLGHKGKPMSKIQKENWLNSIKNRSPQRREEISKKFREIQLQLQKNKAINLMGQNANPLPSNLTPITNSAIATTN